MAARVTRLQNEVKRLSRARKTRPCAPSSSSRAARRACSSLRRSSRGPAGGGRRSASTRQREGVLEGPGRLTVDGLVASRLTSSTHTGRSVADLDPSCKVASPESAHGLVSHPRRRGHRARAVGLQMDIHHKNVRSSGTRFITSGLGGVFSARLADRYVTKSSWDMSGFIACGCHFESRHRPPAVCFRR